MNHDIEKYSEDDLQKKVQTVGGLLLTGAGLSMAIDAGTKRLQRNKWFWYGTLSLVVFQAGLCLVIGSACNKKK